MYIAKHVRLKKDEEKARIKYYHGSGERVEIHELALRPHIRWHYALEASCAKA